METRLKKVRIISDLGGYGPYPEPDEPVEQRLTISSNGRVWFSEYNAGQIGADRYPIGRKIQLSIGKERASELLSLVATYCSAEQTQVFCTDIGTWKMTTISVDGQKQKLSGSMCGGVAVDGTDLTQYIRSVFLIEDLAVFGD